LLNVKDQRVYISWVAKSAIYSCSV